MRTSVRIETPPAVFNADFRDAEFDDTFSHFAESSISEFHSQVREPRDRRRRLVEFRFAQYWIVTPAVESHDDPPPLFDLYYPGRLHKLAIHALGFGLAETVQLCCQPSIAAVRKNCQDRVQVHVQTHFARQAIQVKEID